MNLADFFTLLRIILAPISVSFLFIPIPHQELFAAGVFILAGITDGLDGYVARLRNETSAFGKFFDPLADKILIGAGLISLYKLGTVSLLVVCLILGREVLITVLRLVAQNKGLSIAASIWGKIKTVFQITAVFLLILQWPGANLILGLAVFFTLFSGVDYLFKWRKAFSVNLNRRLKGKR